MKLFAPIFFIALFSSDLFAQTEEAKIKFNPKTINRISIHNNTPNNTNCGVDTIYYQLEKENSLGTGLFFADAFVGNVRTAAQTFPNEGAITVHGIKFYAYALNRSDTLHKIDVEATLFNVDSVGQPTTIITNQTDSINGFNSFYAINFATPQVVTGSFAIGIRLNTGATNDTLIIYTNNATASTYGEDLGWRKSSGGNWRHTTNFFGQDLEYMVFPIISYDIDDSFSLPNNAICVNDSITINYTGTSAYIANSRFFNLNAFNEFWLGSTNETFYIDINGTATNNDSLTALVSTSSGNFISDASIYIQPFSTSACVSSIQYNTEVKDFLRLFADNDRDGYGDNNTLQLSCNQLSDFVNDSTDCNDNDSLINPLTAWYLDADNDGFGSATDSLIQCSQPLGYVLRNDDCNDTSTNINPTSIWFADNDNDGYGNISSSITNCIQSTGYVSNSIDCNDMDSSVTPLNVWYRDFDGDSFGDAGTLLTSCIQPLGYVNDSSDCDDNNALINPFTIWYQDVDNDGYGDAGISETNCSSTLINPVLNNTDCNDSDSSIFNLSTHYSDNDNDGYGDLNNIIQSCTTLPPNGYVNNSNDCDDTNPLIYSGSVNSAQISIDASNEPSILFTSTYNQGTLYIWDFGDGSPSDSGILATHIYTTNGLYNVSVTIKDTCDIYTATNNILVSTIGKNNLYEKGSPIIIYPIPAKDFLTITVDAKSIIRFFNELGQTIATTYSPAKIDVSNLANGVYFVQVINGDFVKVSKVIIER